MKKSKTKLLKPEWKLFLSTCQVCGYQEEIPFMIHGYTEDEHGDLQQIMSLTPTENVWKECPKCQKITLFVP